MTVPHVSPFTDMVDVIETCPRCGFCFDAADIDDHTDECEGEG